MPVFCLLKHGGKVYARGNAGATEQIFLWKEMAGAERFELTTYGFGDRRSTS